MRLKKVVKVNSFLGGFSFSLSESELGESLRGGVVGSGVEERGSKRERMLWRGREWAASMVIVEEIVKVVKGDCG